MSQAFGLKPGERRVVNFGSPLGEASVRVTVTDASGRPLRDGTVTLASTQQDDRSAPDKPDARGSIADDGAATLKCAPGTYLVLVRGYDGNHGSLGEVDVLGPGDFAFDVSLKGGHSIHGTLVWPNGQPREDKTSKVGVALRREPLPQATVTEVSTPRLEVLL